MQKKVVAAKKLRMAVLLMLGVSVTSLAVASTPTDNANDITEVVVTATRSAVDVDKVPANVGVITGKQIKEQHYTDMSQVLRDMPGSYVGNYGSGVGYENSNNLYLNGSNNVVWMVDGVIMNNAGVNPPLVSLKNMDNIQRVEVVKGAASALYGSSAVGGVINIITKKPKNGMETTIRGMAGSYDARQYMLMNQGRDDAWSWRVSYQKDQMGDYSDAQGLRIPQRLNSHTTSVMLGKEISDTDDVAIFYDSYRANMKYADSNKKLHIQKEGTSSFDTWRGVWNARLATKLDNTATILYNKYKTNYNHWQTDITTLGLADQLTYTLDKHTIVGGFDWRQDKVNSMDGVKLTNMSYYVQDAWNFAPRWTLTPGVRLDHHSAFGSHTSPHVALSYDINDRTNAYVSYNSYFIAPTPNQLFSFYGNPNMKPETGHAWEIGLTHQFDDTFGAGIHFFTRSSTDKIGYSYATSKYANFDTEKAHGLSLDLHKTFNKSLSARLGYTFTHIDATPQRTVNADGYVPKHAIVFGLDYTQEKWDAHLDVRGTINRPGPQTADAYPKFFPKDTYWITDISANYHVNKNVTVFGRVNNLFDVFYAEASNAREQWWGEPEEWWTAPGRNFQIGAEVKF